MCQKVKCLFKVFLVGGEGVEPSQEYPADLQSVGLTTCSASPLKSYDPPHPHRLPVSTYTHRPTSTILIVYL